MIMAAATHHFSFRTSSATPFSLQVYKDCPVSSVRVFLNSDMKRKLEGAELRLVSFTKSLRTMAIRHKPKVVVPKVTARELDRILGKARTMPLVLCFYATWCGPCILMAQEIEILQLEYSNRVRFLKVDTDEEYDLAQNMEIRGLPTLVFISSDPKEPAVRMEGLVPGYVVRGVINKGLKVLENASPAASIQKVQVSDSIQSNDNVELNA